MLTLTRQKLYEQSQITSSSKRSPPNWPVRQWRQLALHPLPHPSPPKASPLGLPSSTERVRAGRVGRMHGPVDELSQLLARKLCEPDYAPTYATEADFEEDVWHRVLEVMKTVAPNGDPTELCLSSHERNAGRSAAAWQAFCLEDHGPDVAVLGSKNRLDIVVKHPDGNGSIGLEVKCLGGEGHCGKVTQGLGQAMLGLHHRDRIILVIHCGSVSAEQRDELRSVAASVCAGILMSVLVVP